MSTQICTKCNLNIQWSISKINKEYNFPKEIKKYICPSTFCVDHIYIYNINYVTCTRITIFPEIYNHKHVSLNVILAH